MNYLVVGDPSGRHTLMLIESGINPSDIYVWEDSTKGQYSVKIEGATVTDNLDDFDGMKFDVVIGNPPYGSGGNLAIKFLNKCGDLSDDIRLVLPLSVRKVSSLNKIRLDLVCVEDTKLPDDTFSGGIRTVSQRWVKSDTLRDKIPTFTKHPDFEFVSAENADVFIGRTGSGPAGRVKTTDFSKYTDTHYFLKVRNSKVTDNLISIGDELRELSNSGNGRRTLSKHDLIKCYIQHFGRGKIPTITTHPDFEFVKKETNTANVFVMRSGNAGRVLTEGFDDYEWSHYFIKAKDQQVIDNLLAISSELVELGKTTNGMNKVSKHELVTTYMKHFD